MDFKHLDTQTLNGVIQAMIGLGWTSDTNIEALTATMSPAFVGTALPAGGGTPRLIVFVNKVNSTKVLVSGDVPMEQLLSMAVILAGGRPEEIVFRTALERMSVDGRAQRDSSSPTLVPEPDVAAVPSDEGTLEIAIGEDDTIEVDFLTRGVQAARSITKLLVHRHFEGAPSMLAGNEPDLGKGTGWLLAPRLLITNHHVVNARMIGEVPATSADFALQGSNTIVRFDYLKDTSPMVLTTTAECVAADKTLDFALLRLAADAPERAPLRLRSNPITKPKERQLRERVNVLQHPDGRPMRLGFRNNFVVAGSAERLSYLTDTAGGSSGSPICDDKWFAAALHRGFMTITGDPVIVWGVPIHQENYGTPIGAILAHLQAEHPQLHDEVVAAQASLPADD